MKPMFGEYLENICNDWTLHRAEDDHAWIWNGVPDVWITSYRSNKHADSAEPLQAWVLTKCKLYRGGLVYTSERGRVLDSLVKCCDLSELKLELVKLDLSIPRSWA